jgi:uridine kinase
MPSGSCIPGKPLVVTIVGAAGAGKSVLAKAVANALGDHVAARVPADYFFVPRALDESLATFLARPLAWDWPLLAQRLALPFGSVTSTPDVDFDAFLRRAGTGGIPLPIRPVMLVDAMGPYPEADVIVRLDVPAEVRRQRIVMRDERWGTRVQDRWAHLEATWQATTLGVPDLVLDGTRPLERNARAVLSILDKCGHGNRRDEQ